MIRALVKKQIAQVFSWLYMDNRHGKRRQGKALLRTLLLYGFLFVYIAAGVFFMAKPLCELLVPMGLTWFYFAIVGLLSLAIGVVGSVFSSYASLYGAKDNDLLLSMPIPTHYVLISRLIGVWATGYFYGALVFYPALVVWFIYGEVTPLGVLLTLVIPDVLSILVLSLSCLLGFVVSLIAAHTRHKSLVVTVLSLGLLALYFWGYSKLLSKLTELLSMLDRIADATKNILFPLYHMGRAAEGNALSMLIFTGIVLGLFAIVYAVLSVTFLRLATTNLGTAKRTYRAREQRASGVTLALVKKELRRLFTSPVYLLNCGLGAVMLPACGIAMFVMRDNLQPLMEAVGMIEDIGEALPLALAAMLCMMLSMVDTSAPSLSLEGKTLWQLQVLPVTSWEILRAKLIPPFVLGIPALAVALPFILVTFKLPTPYLFLIPATALVYLCMLSLLGLAANLLFPNFKWTNEMVPVKQSVSVAIALLGGMAFVAAAGVVYYLLREHVTPVLYLSLFLVLLCALSAGLYAWLRTRGVKRFEQL